MAERAILLQELENLRAEYEAREKRWRDLIERLTERKRDELGGRTPLAAFQDQEQDGRQALRRARRMEDESHDLERQLTKADGALVRHLREKHGSHKLKEDGGSITTDLAELYAAKDRHTQNRAAAYDKFEFSSYQAELKSVYFCADGRGMRHMEKIRKMLDDGKQVSALKYLAKMQEPDFPTRAWIRMFCGGKKGLERYQADLKTVRQWIVAHHTSSMALDTLDDAVPRVEKATAGAVLKALKRESAGGLFAPGAHSQIDHYASERPEIALLKRLHERGVGNLTEADVVSEIRKDKQVGLPGMRKALSDMNGWAQHYCALQNRRTHDREDGLDEMRRFVKRAEKALDRETTLKVPGLGVQKAKDHISDILRREDELSDTALEDAVKAMKRHVRKWAPEDDMRRAQDTVARFEQGPQGYTHGNAARITPLSQQHAAVRRQGFSFSGEGGTAPAPETTARCPDRVSGAQPAPASAA